MPTAPALGLHLSVLHPSFTASTAAGQLPDISTISALANRMILDPAAPGTPGHLAPDHVRGPKPLHHLDPAAACCARTGEADRPLRREHRHDHGCRHDVLDALAGLAHPTRQRVPERDRRIPQATYP